MYDYKKNAIRLYPVDPEERFRRAEEERRATRKARIGAAAATGGLVTAGIVFRGEIGEAVGGWVGPVFQTLAAHSQEILTVELALAKALSMPLLLMSSLLLLYLSSRRK